jgi:DNA-binding HxlR family transcriptional regulator
MLDQILSFVQNNLMASAGIAGLMLEAVLRLIKTEKPKSILYAIADGAHKVADILKGIATFLDKILPQRLK